MKNIADLFLVLHYFQHLLSRFICSHIFLLFKIALCVFSFVHKEFLISILGFIFSFEILLFLFFHTLNFYLSKLWKCPYFKNRAKFMDCHYLHFTPILCIVQLFILQKINFPALEYFWNKEKSAVKITKPAFV